MSLAAPEQDEITDLSEFEDPAVPCDVKMLQRISKLGLPDCPDDPAEWIAWKHCPCGVEYRLICTHCKGVYQAWAAKHASIACANCGSDCGGFHDFTPIKGS